jgi:hypothetical protein
MVAWSRWLVAVAFALACFGACWAGLALTRVGDTWVQVGMASVPLVVILAAQGVRAKRSRANRRSSVVGDSVSIILSAIFDPRANRRSSMVGDSGAIILSALMKSPDIPKMPSGYKRRLLEDFVKELRHLTTDPAYSLKSWEEMFILWLHEEPSSPPSSVLRGIVYDSISRRIHASQLPEGPPPKGTRGYVQKGIRGYLQKGKRGYIQLEAAEATNPQPEAAEVINIQPEAAEVINSDEQLRIEWSTLNDDIRRIYEILGPPPLKILTGGRSGR